MQILPAPWCTHSHLRASPRSEVSRICAGLDKQVEVFRTRPLEGRYPYLFLDGKVEKVRDGGRVVRKCVVRANAPQDARKARPAGTSSDGEDPDSNRGHHDFQRVALGQS